MTLMVRARAKVFLLSRSLSARAPASSSAASVVVVPVAPVLLPEVL